MKKLNYFSLAVLVLSLLAIPAAAQKGKDRDNKGGANTGDTARTWLRVPTRRQARARITIRTTTRVSAKALPRASTRVVTENHSSSFSYFPERQTNGNRQNS